MARSGDRRLRGVEQRIDRAALLGIPVRRLQTLVWAVAATLSFVGLFQLLGIVFLVVVPLVLLMKRPRASGGPGAATAH